MNGLVRQSTVRLGCGQCQADRPKGGVEWTVPQQPALPSCDCLRVMTCWAMGSAVTRKDTMRKAVCTGLALALVATAVAPAMAGSYGSYSNYSGSNYQQSSQRVW